jgi:serine phosphatase RsbU (regulator of sigma subunit)
LPSGWQTDVVLRSAGGGSFSGDFIVAARSRDCGWLEVVLVDVSGKGVDAGSRALLLSGAFGGLLGSLSREEFLPAANAYLLRQEWDEGFATAAHLAVDLATGDYEMTSAGHPPGAQFVARTGRWQTTNAEGPLLGVIPSAEYVPYQGRLDVGDALLLYTDGILEGPGRDFEYGIDRLLGEAERLVTGGFRHGARKLVATVGAAETDDRALFLIWRT